MANMTKKGARSVTVALDQLATLMQENHETLGIPQRIANDFSYRCDLLSDRIESTAGIKRHALSELDVNKEKGFDPEAIGEEVSGPIEGDADESFMKAEFTQQENRELRERVQDGDLGMKPNMEEQAPQAGKQASTTVRLASACGKLMIASSVDNAVLSNNIAKLASLASQIHVAHQSGLVSSVRAERTLTAINHVLAALSNNKKDPVKSAAAVALAYKIVAKKSEDEEEVAPEEVAKEAKNKKGEIPPQFQENVDKKKEEAKEKEEKEGAKKSAFNLFA